MKKNKRKKFSGKKEKRKKNKYMFFFYEKLKKKQRYRIAENELKQNKSIHLSFKAIFMLLRKI